MRTKHI